MHLFNSFYGEHEYSLKVLHSFKDILHIFAPTNPIDNKNIKKGFLKHG